MHEVFIQPRWEVAIHLNLVVLSTSRQLEFFSDRLVKATTWLLSVRPEWCHRNLCYLWIDELDGAGSRGTVGELDNRRVARQWSQKG